jgi:hypothetical protein
MENTTNDLNFDLSSFNASDALPDNTSEKFYRASPAQVEPPDSGSSILSGFDNVVSKNFDQAPASPTVSTYYPKELTEKYKGTAAYSPWMDPYADNESVAAKNWGTWDAITTGLSGMWDNAMYAGKEYAMFYPRLGRALLTLDPSLINPTDAETAISGEEQKEIYRNNPVFYDPNSEDDIFSRQFLAETLQNTGFTFGTMGAFVAENALFGGVGKLIAPLFKAGAASKSMRIAEIGAEGLNLSKNEINLAQQTRNLIQNGSAGRLGGKTAWDYALNVGSKLPFIDAIADTTKLLQVAGKAGLTAGELRMIGAGGLRRGMSEWNFAASESAVEAGGVYGDTFDQLYDSYLRKGIEITPDIIDQIRKDSLSAASKDYAINVAILGVTNKITFGNLFRNFGTDSKFINILRSQGERTISVMGKTEGGKMLAKSLPRKFLGILGHRKELLGTKGVPGAFVNGKEIFRKELKKDLIRGVSRFEISEGIQENLQEGTSVAIKDYYADLYDRDVASWGDSFKQGVEEQFTKTGLKTFLSGALMGFFTRPVTGAIQGAKETYEEYKLKKANPNHVNALDNTLKELNTFYAAPERVLFEPIKAMKKQIALNQGMVRSAAQGEKYDYFNHSDSGIIELALHAKRTGTFDVFKDYIKAYGAEFSEKDFKEATGIDIGKTKIGSVQEFTNGLVAQLDRYGELHDKYMDRFSDYMTLDTLTDDPYRKQRYSFNQMAIRNAVHIVAFNEAKAQSSTMRAASISQKISQVEAIGSAAASTFNTITSHAKASDAIRILENEIKILKETKDKSRATTKLLNQKKEERKLLRQWLEESYEEKESKEEDGEKIYLPLNRRAMSKETKDRMARILTKYYAIKNSQNDVDVPIKSEDVRKVLTDINDYQKLTDDTRDYIDAVNLLSDPDNFTKFATNNKSALVAAFARIAHDVYKKGLATESQVFKEYLDANPDDLNSLLSIARSPFNAYDSMDKVYKAIENINSLSEKQKLKDEEIFAKKEEERIKKIEQFLEDAENMKARNLALLSEEEQVEFVAEHYEISEDKKSIERKIKSVVDNKDIVTHTVKIKDILKQLKKDSFDDISDDELVAFYIEVEQNLWRKENPLSAKENTNDGQRTATTTTVSKKVRNLVGQKVSVKGRKGEIIREDDGAFYIKFDDDPSDMVPLGEDESENIVFNWEIDEDTGKMVAIEADPNKIVSLDQFPEVTLLDDNLTEQDQEITGVTRDSKTIRIQDISHNVEYVDNDSIKIDGKLFTIGRDENGEIVRLEHRKGKRNIIYTKNEMYADPTSLSAEHISLVEQFLLQQSPLTNLTDQELDSMLEQAGNEQGVTEGKLIGSRRAKSKKSLSEEERQLQVENTMFDWTEEQANIFAQVMAATNNEQIESIPIEDRENIKKWALDTIKKLSKLDATNEIIFLTDILINPLSKSSNEFNNRDSSTKRVTKKETTTPDGSKRTKSSTGKQSAPSEVKETTITGGAGAVEKMYDGKEVKVQIDDLISVAPSSIYTKDENKKVRKAFKFSARTYKENLSKTEKPKSDPFEDPDLYTC